MDPHETGIAAPKHTGTKPGGEEETDKKHDWTQWRSFCQKWSEWTYVGMRGEEILHILYSETQCWYVYRYMIRLVLRWIKQMQKYVVFCSSGGIINPQSQIHSSVTKPCTSCFRVLISWYVTWQQWDSFLFSLTRCNTTFSRGIKKCNTPSLFINVRSKPTTL